MTNQTGWHKVMNLKCKGGMVVVTRHITIWLIMVTIAALWALVKLKEKKENYTDLHRRVTSLENSCKTN